MFACANCLRAFSVQLNTLLELSQHSMVCRIQPKVPWYWQNPLFPTDGTGETAFEMEWCWDMQCLRLAIPTGNHHQMLGELGPLALCWLPRMSGIVQWVPCAPPPIVRIVLLEYFLVGNVLDLVEEQKVCPAQMHHNLWYLPPTLWGLVTLPQYGWKGWPNCSDFIVQTVNVLICWLSMDFLLQCNWLPPSACLAPY